MSKVEFWRDPNMDAMIEDIIDIFKLEGVELVRLSGMTRRARRIAKKSDIPFQAIDNIIRKLNNHNIIKFDYITKCPHCGEISYIIKYKEDFLQKPKLCDTCSTFFNLLENDTLEIIKDRS